MEQFSMYHILRIPKFLDIQLVVLVLKLLSPKSASYRKIGFKAPHFYGGFLYSWYNYVAEYDVKMLVFEAKLEGTNEQYGKLDEAIRTARFVRNSCIKYWMGNKDIGRYELSAYCAVLAKEFEWANNLNSMARQASAEKPKK